MTTMRLPSLSKIPPDFPYRTSPAFCRATISFRVFADLSCDDGGRPTQRFRHACACLNKRGGVEAVKTANVFRPPLFRAAARFREARFSLPGHPRPAIFGPRSSCPAVKPGERKRPVTEADTLRPRPPHTGLFHVSTSRNVPAQNRQAESRRDFAKGKRAKRFPRAIHAWGVEGAG